MASGYWSITNRTAAGNATATQTAASAAATAGTQQIRLRSFTVSVASSAGMQILDGATVIYQVDFSAATVAPYALDSLDLRATAGNNLTIQISGNTGISDVNAVGDLVPVGYPVGQP